MRRAVRHHEDLAPVDQLDRDGGRQLKPATGEHLEQHVLRDSCPA